METPQNIRNLYLPIQPTISHSSKGVIYTEFTPDPGLQHFIYCYWQLKTQAPLQEAFTYRVVADGCIDIFFDRHHANESFVMGFCKKYTEFQLHDSFEYIGIRFLPTMFSQLFAVDAKELSNRVEELELVYSPLSHFLSNRLDDTMSPQKICQELDGFLLQLIRNREFNFDSRLYEAIDLILSNTGVIDLATDINTGISQRQLRRLFEFYVGDSPKVFSKIVRFQHILRAKPSSTSLRKSKLFYNAGYYDQAYFIKEFKNFYGVSPSKAFGR